VCEGGREGGWEGGRDQKRCSRLGFLSLINRGGLLAAPTFF
jgi:hypothetical protein